MFNFLNLTNYYNTIVNFRHACRKVIFSLVNYVSSRDMYFSDKHFTVTITVTVIITGDIIASCINKNVRGYDDHGDFLLLTDDKS